MTEREKLKPCPFCGGDNIELDEQLEGWFVGCYECPCHLCVDFRNREAAIKAWNTRAAQDEWISVEDERPLLNKSAWVYTKKGQQFKAKRIKGRDVYLVDGLAYIENVTHWKPLPAAPQQ